MPTPKSTHGGARTGAGRKAKAEERELKRLLNKCWTKELREKAFTIFAQRAAAGGTEAFKVLTAYMFGKPAQRLIVEEEPKGEGGNDRLDLSQLTEQELIQLEQLIAKARRGESGTGQA
jgi:hypothetical protein